MLRRKRMVRLHLDGSNPSIEGLLVGSPFGWADHYVIRTATLVAGEDQSHDLEGHDVRVPRERVVFLQTLR